MKSGESILLALALDFYRVKANEEMKRLRRENDDLRNRLANYRLISQIFEAKL